MKIDSLKIAGLYSFGSQQEFNNFKYFNLFIGENGSGKTNVFKILEGIGLDYDIIREPNNNPEFRTFNFFSGKINTVTTINTFVPSISSEYINSVNNRILHGSNLHKLMELIYTDNDGFKNLIKLEDCNGGNLRYIQGDIGLQKRCIKKLEKPQSEAEFYKDLVLFYGQGNIYLPLLNFGLCYIFGARFRFHSNGSFIQSFNYGSGNIENNSKELPSGTLHCAQLLTKYFMCSGTVVLIDEPELHFEPRALRRFFEFLLWFNVRNNSSKSEYEKEVYDKIQLVLNTTKCYNSEISLFSEPNGHNEDGTQKYINVSDSDTVLLRKQIFIASHSNILINEFVNLEENASIYRFSLQKADFLQDDNTQFPHKNFTKKVTGTFTKISKIADDANDILDDLGCKGSDLLQANGIIWVEGPSDVIYVKKWLKMYAKETFKKIFKQGIDYEFQMFGGTILDSLCLIKDDKSNEDEGLKKIVSMFSFSKNAFVITDSDAVLKKGTIIDKSKFASAKKYIKKQFDQISKSNLGIWYKEGDIEIRTIENYIPRSLQKSEAKTKKLKAQENVILWDIEVKLSDFNCSLEKEIKILYELIEKWNV